MLENKSFKKIIFFWSTYSCITNTAGLEGMKNAVEYV